MIPFTLTATNGNNSITLTDHTEQYICEYTGLNPPAAVIASQEMYGRPGAMFVAQKAAVRNVVLQIRILKEAQTVRESLYTVFKMGNDISFSFNNGSAKGTLTFSGVCESFEFVQFDQPEGAVLQGVQISILCFDPYLYGAQVTTNTASAVVYSGDYPIGFTISYPFNYGSLTPTTDEAYCRVTNSGVVRECRFQVPEVSGSGTYVINTHSHTAQLQASGGNRNITRYWMHGSEWALLMPGSNTVNPSNANATLRYKPAYMGV